MQEIWKFDLVAGNSENPSDGACLLDAVNWFTNGVLGDHPPDVCPVLAAFCRWINDGLSDEHRQRLKVFIPRIAGSFDPSHISDRAEYLRRECGKRARVALGKKPPVPSRKRLTVAHMEAVASSNACDLMTIYQFVRQNEAVRLRDGRVLRAEAVVDDVCDILDAALRLGKQGWVYRPRLMRQANESFEQARKPRLAPLDNGRQV